jgi:hypothetical protein
VGEWASLDPVLRWDTVLRSAPTGVHRGVAQRDTAPSEDHTRIAVQVPAHYSVLTLLIG